MKIKILCIFSLSLSLFGKTEKDLTYPIVDTGQERCYNNWHEIPYPKNGKAFYGQDAQYEGNKPTYKDNKDGTVSDLVTGLLWSKGVNSNKVSLAEAEKIAKNMTLGGHADWRVPTIKELYSLIDFRGYTGTNTRGLMNQIPVNSIPYINTKVFDFKYGKINEGERYIDAQWLTRTQYVSTTMHGAKTLFGVNFADGRIKGYGYSQARRRGREKKFYARYVRGEKKYGNNQFVDNRDGTVSDKATGLMWMKEDSGKGMTWEQALLYAERLEYAEYKDWRLPNVKELHSIVDYSRSPETSDSAAIDSIFKISNIKNEGGEEDYPYFWTSTTHLDGPNPGAHGAYIAFGRAMGQMFGKVMDVHGAGAQRSDPKTPIQNLTFRGPQGDAIRSYNYVRCVRGGDIKLKATGPAILQKSGTHKNPLQGGLIARLDKNKDRKISRGEFDGPSKHFRILDQDDDGYISEEEALQFKPPPPPHRRRY